MRPPRLHIKWTCLLACILLFSSGVQAQRSRQFDEGYLEEQKERQVYQYGTEQPPGVPERSEPWSQDARLWLKWGMYVLIGGSFLALIILIIRRTLLNRSQVVPPVAEETAEDLIDLREVNTQSLLQEALAQQDYQRAVRWLFLDTLRRMSQKGHVDWQPHKTNSAYLTEIPIAQQASFGQLLRAYEYIWYGGFPIPEEAFQPLHKQFVAFQSELKL